MSYPKSQTKTPPRGTAGEREEQPTEKVGLLVDGRYQICELLGRGGMGSVYKAEHKGIGRFVALKLLHPSLAQVPEIAKRFEREALAVGSIEHPNCVDVSDFGKLEDGTLYLVMEYLEGQSLGDLLADERRIEPRRALHIMRHMLRGLGHAHAADIIHRDMKPENVLLVEEDGDKDFAKILDFGIAKLVGRAEDSDGVKLTQAGVAFGTPVYMSPEQAVGNPIDGRADLYGATVVLYEMIAGKPPFYSDDKLEVLSMHTTRPPPPFAEVAPDLEVAPEIEQLVMRGLAKRPDDRFVNAEAYVAAIDALLAPPSKRARGKGPKQKRLPTAPVVYGSGAHASLPTRSPTAYPVSQKGKKNLLILGLVTVGLVAAAIVAALLVGGNDENTADADRQAKSANSAKAPSVIEQATTALADKRPSDAITILEKDLQVIENNFQAQLQLGHAYAAAKKDRDSVRAYERALTLDERAKVDERLRANLMAMLSPKRGDLGLDAADILVGKLGDEEAATKLVNIASSGKIRQYRNRALDLVRKHNLSDRVSWLDYWLLELHQRERCKQRLEVVSELKKLGKKKAIAKLKTARYRKSKKKKYKGVNINKCLTKEAAKAIAYLKKHGT